MNDSCFGPLFDLEQVYLRMEQKDIDFWGLTEFRESNYGMPGTNERVPAHLQSYFLCFNKKTINSETFQIFWRNVDYEKDIDAVIQKYETQLTLLLQNSGLVYGSFFNIAPQTICKLDLSKQQAYILKLNKIPMIKIKAFLGFECPYYLIDLIKKNTDYPVRFIENYFSDYYNPNTSILINNKLIPARISERKDYSSLKIAIHLHVFYLDIFERYIEFFDNYSFRFDLFITTDTLGKKEHIENFIATHNAGLSVKEIIVFQNLGRDIFPWLLIADRISTYDIAAHLHTKKSITAYDWIGITWQEELFNLLVVPASTIIETFENNTKIGIIIPEIPFYFHVIYPISFVRDINAQLIMNSLWEKMGCNKNIDFTNLSTLIFPYGTMCWYRPRAFKSLVDLGVKTNDIPLEPIALQGTVLHAIERLLVYLAWNEGYDYRIMVPETPHVSNFIENMRIEKTNKELETIMHSKPYRIGNLMLTLPRKMKALYRYFKKK
jgi:rhamnosyltransferase